MKQISNNEYLSTVFKYNHSTEYNTFFNRYIVVLIDVNGNVGTLGVLDTDQHPTVYYHITVTFDAEESKVVIDALAYQQSEHGLPKQIDLDDSLSGGDYPLSHLVRGFSDWVSSLVDQDGKYDNFIAVPHQKHDTIIAPVINMVGGAGLAWAMKSNEEAGDGTDFYFPMFVVKKDGSYFSYSKGILSEQPVDFSDINEFINSEYYITGDDVAPFVKIQQKACLLEVEKLLMGTIN